MSCILCLGSHESAQCGQAREMQHKHANLGQSRSEECEKGMEKVSVTSFSKNPKVFLQTLRLTQLPAG